MPTFQIKAWKEPSFSASTEIEADSLEHALQLAKDHPWQDEPFEDCGSDWPEPYEVSACPLDADGYADIDKEVDLNLDPPTRVHATAMFTVLQEFVEDVYAAYGSDLGGLDWPDLLVTYKNAVAVLDKIKAPASVCADAGANSDPEKRGG
jgi:hypothetical protein